MRFSSYARVGAKYDVPKPPKDNLRVHPNLLASVDPHFRMRAIQRRLPAMWCTDSPIDG
jgi:hypothetical protein